MSDLPLRPELVGRSAYGAPQIDVPIRLNTNENPYPPPPEMIADIAAAVAPDLNRYPDRDAHELRAALAGYLSAQTGIGLSSAQVWAANGSNEILQQILQAFGGPGRTALGFTPGYTMHELISRGTGTAFVPVPRNGLDLHADQIVAAVQEFRPDVLFLCSPNNPTGESLPLSAVEAAYDAVVATDRGIVVVDEAYGEFASVPSAVHLLHDRPRLLVTRTMSKAFAFAGARVGYVACAPSVVDALLLVRLPYHLSSLTQSAATVAVAYSDRLEEQVRQLRATRDAFVARVQELGWQCRPTDANFVLLGPFVDPAAAWQRLLAAGILVRDVGLDRWLRVTIGTDDQMAALAAELTHCTDLRETG
ncbi:MAG: histidinol-phosphate transaminase [Candidatus Nanopelagicales bacterium]|nr:histidinol-phosphate transaminase [Candidatus Nanopelagicales bacterium]MCU0294572.1 histidinol-phosphate transaminase [Candidatus Nanopelagicales bacterium]MCU0297799.1 histidinol-phosphate transaminase [Candidatus Nanopelagicales bacterium]